MNAAETAQRLRRELLSWPDVSTIHGPALGKTDQYFLRFVFADGTSYAVELTKDEDES